VKEEILTLVGTLLGRVYERPTKTKMGHVEKREERKKKGACPLDKRQEGRKEEEREREGSKGGISGKRKQVVASFVPRLGRSEISRRDVAYLRVTSLQNSWTPGPPSRGYVYHVSMATVLYTVVNISKDHRLKTPLFRLRDWTGKMSTREIPSPTVSPMDTEISFKATWNPIKYDVELPEACWDAKCSRPPLPRPDGS